MPTIRAQTTNFSYSRYALAKQSFAIAIGRKGAIEEITRTGLSEEVLKKLAARRPPVDDSGEADFRFGGPSRFSLVEPEQPTNPRVSVTVNGGGEEEPIPPEAQMLVYTEIHHETEDVRVENPDDPEDYVIVRRRIYSIFLGPDGLYRQFIYKNSGLE